MSSLLFQFLVSPESKKEYSDSERKNREYMYAVLWIQQKGKEHVNKTVNSGLFVLLDSSIE